MSSLRYEIVRHEGGWAYKAGDVYSERFASHDDALAAARAAAERQEIRGEDETIEYQDDRGRWHSEAAGGGDRPETEVVDRPERRRVGPEDEDRRVLPGEAGANDD